MGKRTRAAVTVFAAALLLGPFATLAAAQQPQYPPRNEGGPIEGPAMRVPEPMINLTGMLKSDGADGYMLVDQASGDSITLKKKSKKLGELEGKSVTVTGRWAKNDETTKTFKVSEVEEAPAAAEAPATTPADPSTLIPEDTAIPKDALPPTQPAVPEDPAVPPQDAPAPDVPEESRTTP